jgi:hypothetical protein
VKCARAVCLTAPAGEVETYARLWDLRPWVEEGAAEAIIDAALQLQRRREPQEGEAHPA